MDAPTVVGAKVIESRRLSLSPLGSNDLREVRSLLRDPSVRRYLLDGVIMEAEWFDALIPESDQCFHETGLGLWVARRPLATPLVGLVGFRAFPDAPLELLYALDPGQWRRGLATEMAAAVIDRAFDTGLEEVEASLDAPNSDSVRVLDRLGFRFVERVPVSPPLNCWDQLRFEIDRETWGRRRPSLLAWD